VRCAIQAILLISLLCGLGGCFGPDYGPTYGYPTSGFAPYSYGFPVLSHGYAPNFAVHHPWEEHHEVGHAETFYHAPAGRPSGHVANGHAAYGHR
jgi:hypothetical protein